MATSWRIKFLISWHGFPCLFRSDPGPPFPQPSQLPALWVLLGGFLRQLPVSVLWSFSPACCSSDAHPLLDSAWKPSLYAASSAKATVSHSRNVGTQLSALRTLISVYCNHFLLFHHPLGSWNAENAAVHIARHIISTCLLNDSRRNFIVLSVLVFIQDSVVNKVAVHAFIHQFCRKKIQELFRWSDWR